MGYCKNNNINSHGRRWKVIIKSRADRMLQRLPTPVQDLVSAAIGDLEEQGSRPKYWDVLKTGKEEYRLRLNYRYRMRYRIEEQDIRIDIFYIGSREGVRY